MKFRPLHDRIVVKPSRPRRSRPAVSSFRIPPKKKPSQGEVIAVGPGGRDWQAHSHRHQGR